MYDNKTIEVVENIPTDTNLTCTKWVFAEKDNKKKKARLVTLNCQQVTGEDFIETYSPIVQADRLRLTITIASKFNWDLKQLDIKAAFLNANLEEKNYWKNLYGDKNFNTNKFWLLKKDLYGFKQAGWMWYNVISHYIVSIGFKKYKTDKCLFGKYNKNNKLTCLLTLYVDDILITGIKNEINYTVSKLKDKYKISKDSNATKIIGINIYRTSDGYKINQIDYINKIIEKYNMKKSKQIKTPYKIIREYERNNSNLIDSKEYKSLLGALLYIAVKSRPDIMFSVSEASRICENPTEADYINLINILQNLKKVQKINLYIIIKIINLSDTRIQILPTMKRREDL